MNNLGAWFWTVFIAVVCICYMITSVKLFFSSKKSRIIGYCAYVILFVLLIVAIASLRLQNSGGKGWIYSVNFAYIIGFVLLHIVVATFFLIDDIRRIVTLLTSRLFLDRQKEKEDKKTLPNISRSKFIYRSGWMSGVVLFSTFFVGIKNKYNYKIRRVTLTPKKSNKALSGLKIVHISDIHTGSFDDTEAVLRGIEMINQENPDFVLFTGDIVNNKTDEIYPMIDTLKQLKAKYGIYATLGNHDYGDYWQWNTQDEKEQNLATLKHIIKNDLGWKLMMNEHEKIERNGEHFSIIGIENWGSNMNFPKYGKLDDAYKGLEEDEGYKILMSHDPSHWDAQVRTEYPTIDLTLSGHTHGMQYGIELSWFKWSPVQYVYKQWAGLYTEGNQQLYVNRGFGFLGYRGRVGILPEITVIEFDERLHIS
jgi:predicted MPP superfamily phosphohydrolase